MLTPSAAGMSAPQPAAKPAPNYSVSEGLGREGRVQGGGREAGGGEYVNTECCGDVRPSNSC